MLPIVICIAVPVTVVGLIEFMRSQNGDEIFASDWPSQELNREDDYRLIKLQLNSGKQSDS